MARQRDYAAEYQRRIERGQARGEDRQQAAGHRGPAALGRAIRSGTPRDVLPIPGDRDDRGQFRNVKVVVVDSRGVERTYTVPYSKGRDIARRLDLSGIPYEPKYGLEGPS